jgi:hypothetical protein
MTEYSLDSVVREYLVMRGLDSEHEYPRALQAAVSTHKDLSYDVSGVPKVYLGEVENGNKMTIPQDVIRVIRMGFMDNAGRFVEIFVDNNYVVNVKGTYNSDTDTTAINSNNVGLPIAATSSDVASMVRNGQIIGRQYGTEGGGVYKYRMSWDEGLVEFSSNVSGQVVIEYLGDPNRVDGQYVIHPFLKDPILSGIHYRMMAFKRSYSPTEKQIAKSEYVSEKHKARLRFASQSVGNYYNAARKTFSQTIKY